MPGMVINFYSFYNHTGAYASLPAFNGGLLLGYDFGLLAGQAEVLVTGDKGRFEEMYTSSGTNGLNYNYRMVNFSGTSIQIPLLLKLDFHAWRIMLQPQAGVYFNMPLGYLDYEYNNNSGSRSYRPPLVGLMAGWALGFRIGRGYLFQATRFAMDLGSTTVSGTEVYWDHRAIVLSLGYQYYFKSKR
jgi:hypothetical protein